MQADKEQITRLLKTARGQLDGILHMVEEDQYCINIVNQLLASSAILRKATREVLRGHITNCVAAACESKDTRQREEKLSEVLALLEKLER